MFESSVLIVIGHLSDLNTEVNSPFIKKSGFASVSTFFEIRSNHGAVHEISENDCWNWLLETWIFQILFLIHL